MPQPGDYYAALSFGFAFSLSALRLAMVLSLIFCSLTLMEMGPWLARFDTDAPRIACEGNLRQLALVMHIHQSDRDAYPEPGRWCDVLVSDVGTDADNFLCEGGGDGRCDYAMNPLCEPNSPGDVVLLFESHAGWNGYGGAEWLSFKHTIYSLVSEIGLGAGRIVELVKALKSYTYMDRAPVQSVDVREGLDNTLIILHNKLKGGVTVEREYADDLVCVLQRPHIHPGDHHFDVFCRGHGGQQRGGQDGNLYHHRRNTAADHRNAGGRNLLQPGGCDTGRQRAWRCRLKSKERPEIGARAQRSAMR